MSTLTGVPTLGVPRFRTGEAPWVAKIIESYHERAQAKDLRIVPCCGYVSGAIAWSRGGELPLLWRPV